MNWTPEAVAYLRRHYESKPSYIIAEHLGTTGCAVIGKAHRLGLRVREDERRHRQSVTQRANAALRPPKPIVAPKPKQYTPPRPPQSAAEAAAAAIIAEAQQRERHCKAMRGRP